MNRLLRRDPADVVAEIILTFVEGFAAAIFFSAIAVWWVLT